MSIPVATSGYVDYDDYQELQQKCIDQENYIQKLEAAIRKHRDERSDSRCWLDDEELYKVLPEGYEPPERDCSVELKYCEQYIKSRHNPKTIYVSPDVKIAELEQKLATKSFYDQLPMQIEGLRAKIDEWKVAAWDALKSDENAAIKVIETMYGPQFIGEEPQWGDDELIKTVGKALAFKDEKIKQLDRELGYANMQITQLELERDGGWLKH